MAENISITGTDPTNLEVVGTDPTHIELVGIDPTNISVIGVGSMNDVPGFPAPQPIEFFSFSAVSLTVGCDPPINITAVPISDIVFSLRTKTNDLDNGTLVYSVNSPSVSDEVNGIFTFNFTDSGTEPGYYEYDVWLTTFPKPVAWGMVIVKKQQWQNLQNNE
jgi:hypothetical protein